MQSIIIEKEHNMRSDTQVTSLIL